MISTAFTLIFASSLSASTVHRLTPAESSVIGILSDQLGFVEYRRPPIMTSDKLHEFYREFDTIEDDTHAETDGTPLPYPPGLTLHDDLLLPVNFSSSLNDSSYSPRTLPLWNIWDPMLLPIPFAFDSSVTSSNSSACIRGIFLEAIRRIENATCILFAEASSLNTSQTLMITSKPGQPCYSTLGFSQTTNVINIGHGCMYVGSVTHLILHALGVPHSVQRQDRDSYLNINMDAATDLTPSEAFLLESWSGTRTAWEEASSSIPFDFGSLSGVDGLSDYISPREIFTEKAKHIMGNREFLTVSDVELLKKMYGKSCSAQSDLPFFLPQPRRVEEGERMTEFGLVSCFFKDANIVRLVADEKAKAVKMYQTGAGGSFAQDTNYRKLYYSLIGTGVAILLGVFAFFYFKSFRKLIDPGFEELETVASDDEEDHEFMPLIPSSITQADIPVVEFKVLPESPMANEVPVQVAVDEVVDHESRIAPDGVGAEQGNTSERLLNRKKT